MAGRPLRGSVDLPTLLVVNLAIDIEPLIATLLDLPPPPHGYVHTFVGATVVGIATGRLVWRLRGLLASAFGQNYPLSLRVAAFSGVAGGWLHVALDAVMYSHIRPFYPLATNPLHLPGSGDALHVICAVLLLPLAGLIVRTGPGDRPREGVAGVGLTVQAPRYIP